MNKFITKIATLSVGLAMAIGVGVAVGSSNRAEKVKAAVTFTITLNNKSLANATSYQNEQTTSNYNGGGATASLYWGRINPNSGQISGNSTTQSNLQGGTGNFYIHNTTALNGNIRSITISGITGTTTANKAYAQASSSAISNQTVNNSVEGTSGSSSVTWSFTGNSGGYFAIGAVKGFTSGTVTATTISVVFEESTVAKHKLTYLAGTYGTRTGSSYEYEVAESANHTVLAPADVGISGNTGYLFENWSGSDSKTYNTGDPFTMGTSNVSLTAQWVQGLGLSYDGNGATSGSTETTYVKSGETQTVSANGFTAPDGKQFAHWNTERDDTGDSYDPNDTIENFTVSDTLYAIWENKTSVTFDATVDTGTSPLKKDDITLTLSSGVLDNGTDYRFYKNSILKISRDSGKIGSIEFTGSTQKPISNFTVDVGTLTTSGNNGTWEGAASEVTFTASADQARAVKIVVNYFTGADVNLDKESLTLTVGGSSSTIGVESTEGIVEPTYLWSVLSGDDCVTLNPSTVETSEVSITPKGSKFASCVLRLTVNGTNLQEPVTREATVYVARSSSETPYTIDEAKKAIDLNDNTYINSAKVTGLISRIVSASLESNSGITYWISNDGTTTNELEVYKGLNLNGAAFSSINDLSVGDSVTVFGDLTKYNTTYEFAQGSSLVSHTADSVTLSISGQKTSFVQGETFSLGEATITATYAVSGAKVIANDSDLLSFEYDLGAISTSTVLNVVDYNGATITITYTDANGKTDSVSYDISVSYAPVSSVTLNHHSLTVAPASETSFLVELNSNVNPSSVASWNVANDEGSSLDLTKYSIASTGNLAAKLTCNGNSTDSGRLIVTATVEGISDVCTVTITGEAYVTFNKDSVQGIVGASLNNSVTVTPVGLGTPTGYAWSIKSGEATDVVGATTGSATSTLTFLKAGSTTLHVVVTDGTNNAEGDIDVDVIASLDNIEIPGSTTEYNDAITFSSVCEADATYNDSTISATDFGVYFNKGTNSNAPVYKTTGSAIRVYGGGYFTVSSSHTLKKIELSFGSGDGSNAISTEDDSYENGTWTGSSSSVQFNVGGTSGHRRLSGIKVYWENQSSGTVISNTNYNAQKAVIEFAEDLTSKLNAVCDQVYGNTSLEGEEGLKAKWSAIATTYTSKRNSLSSSDQEVFDALIANATKNASGDALQKALSSYDYVISKYNAAKYNAGLSDFLTASGKAAVQYSINISPIAFAENNSILAVVVVISLVSVTAIGGYFFLRKRKVQ